MALSPYKRLKEVAAIAAGPAPRAVTACHPDEVGTHFDHEVPAFAGMTRRIYGHAIDVSASQDG
jgi:hypothetical protein